MRVLAAMSGGVDSAVAAARAVAAGHEVTGVHLALARNPQTYRSGARGCCTREDARDAGRAADVIGIPFYVWDLADQFHDQVVDDFVAEYAAGHTPNPCLRCNEKIKFAAVLDRALALGFDAVVTGHHARIDPAGRLRRSVDLAKDQSYVLAVLTPAQLRHSIFPLGDSTKAQVRAEAAERGLAVADKPDSHDICFIADGDTRSWLRERLGEAPGDIVDASSGQVIGRHSGAYAYTVGQRKGLDLRVPAPDGRPRYVLSITPVANTVTVGPAEALEVSTIHGQRPIWSAPEQVRAGVQLRAHGEVVPAEVTLAGGTLVAVLDRPVRGIAAGQAMVAYQADPAGDIVLGSATITLATPATARASQTADLASPTGTQSDSPATQGTPAAVPAAPAATPGSPAATQSGSPATQGSPPATPGSPAATQSGSPAIQGSPPVDPGNPAATQSGSAAAPATQSGLGAAVIVNAGVSAAS